MNIEDIKKAFYKRLDSMTEEESIAHILSSEPTGVIEALSVERVHELAFQVENNSLPKAVFRRASYNSFESLVDIVPAVEYCKNVLLTIVDTGLKEPEESKLIPVKVRNYTNVSVESEPLQAVVFVDENSQLGSCELPKKYSYDNSVQSSEFEVNEEFFFVNGKMVSSADSGVAF